MWAHKMSVDDYQNLIDRGWRRSGKYCYKPNMKSTCCPSYTIRCEANNFKLTKSQKKIIKKFNKFLIDGLKVKSSNHDDSTDMLNSKSSDVPASEEHYKQDFEDIPDIDMSKVHGILSGNTETEKIRPIANSNSQQKKGNDSEPTAKVLGADPSKPPRKKAKLLRLEKKAAKQVQLSKDKVEDTKKKPQKNVEKTLEMFLNEFPKERLHTLKLKLVPSTEASTQEEVNVYRKYQTIIHKDEPKAITKKSFENFLIRSPLEQFTDSNGIQYGSFHQQYWLDDKLIAVGVIDILPNCLSSVYFFYDPDYSFLSLGTYGSLREIDFVNQLSKQSSHLCYYYMGFYIHSCPKMIYKAKMHPSYLLCPEVYSWHILSDDISKKLDLQKYQRLNPDESAVDINLFSEIDLDPIKILFDFASFDRFKRYNERHPGAIDVVKYRLFGTLVGKTLSSKMFLCN